MNLAILGADPAILELARAARAGGRHEIVAIADDVDGPGEFREALHALAPHARRLDHWEALLDRQVADAVLVARGSNQDLREEQLRKLAQSEAPLLVSHPVVRSMLVYYELDMIRRDTNAAMRAYLPARRHPAILALVELCGGADPSLGAVEQVTMERRLATRTREAVLSEFARDVDLLRALCGEIARLGALGATADDSAYASLGVQMTGPGGMTIRWSVAPPEDAAASARILVVGASGRATLEIAGHDLPWSLKIKSSTGATSQDFPPWDAAGAALAGFADTVATRAPTDDWVEAARGVELAETIPRSLHRGRTIDLHYDDYTEESTFKGIMASLGCGLLLAGLLVLALVGLGDSLGVPGLGYWRYGFLGVLGVFLLIQLLMLVFPKRGPGPGAS